MQKRTKPVPSMANIVHIILVIPVLIDIALGKTIYMRVNENVQIEKHN